MRIELRFMSGIREGECLGCMEGSHCTLTCPFAPCSSEHGNIEYCFECGEYDGVDEHDSQISHINQFKDMQKAKEIGIEKYHEELIIKREILDELLEKYGEVHSEIFFSLAVNLLPVDDLMDVLKEAEKLTFNKYDSVKGLLNEHAKNRNIVLKLRNDGYYG